MHVHPHQSSSEKGAHLGRAHCMLQSPCKKGIENPPGEHIRLQVQSVATSERLLLEERTHASEPLVQERWEKTESRCLCDCITDHFGC